MKTKDFPKNKYKGVCFLLSLLFVLSVFSVTPALTVSAADVGDEAALFDAVAKGGDITLTESIKTTKCLIIPEGVTVTLDLNGKTLDRGLVVQKERSNLIVIEPNEEKPDDSESTECFDLGSVIRVEPGAELTVKDSSGNNSGVITGGASYNGGGICNHGALTFEGGTIKGNKALHDTHGGGGGIFSNTNDNESVTLTITGGVIENNEARCGSGIFLGNGSGSVTVNNCTIRNNVANDQGGGVYIYQSVNCNLSKTTISDNFSYGTGGGIYLCEDGQITIKDSTLSENICRADGGAIWMGSSQNTKAKLKKCEIKDNVASDCGGGIYTQGEGELVIDECSLTSNAVSSDMGSAVYAEKQGLKLALIDVDISDNLAYNQGAVCAKGSVITMKGLVTIEGNTSKNKKSQANLYLTDDSYIGNPGLYPGSKIMISGAQKLFAKEISEYQSKYFTFEVGKADFQEEKTVDTPLVASLFGNGGVIVAIILAALGVIAMIIAAFIKKKKSAKGGAKNEDK